MYESGKWRDLNWIDKETRIMNKLEGTTGTAEKRLEGEQGNKAEEETEFGCLAEKKETN